VRSLPRPKTALNRDPNVLGSSPVNLVKGVISFPLIELAKGLRQSPLMSFRECLERVPVSLSFSSEPVGSNRGLLVLFTLTLSEVNKGVNQTQSREPTLFITLVQLYFSYTTYNRGLASKRASLVRKSSPNG
jgi:hypothetical protein